MKCELVDVARKEDRIMTVKLVSKEKVLNVINAYAPQVECKKWEREVLARDE